MVMNIFERYQELKRNFDYVYRGVRLNKVSTIMLWDLAKHSSVLNLKSFAKLFFHLDLRELREFAEDDWVLSFGRYNRKDHIELFENILKRLNRPMKYAKPFNWGKKVCFHPVLIFNTYRFVFKAAACGLTFSEKCCLANDFVFYANAIDEVWKYDFSKTKKFVCLCDSLEIENLLTQFFKIRNVPTYAFTEGIMFIYKGDVPFDSVQYENLTADYKLCWGNYTRDEFKQYGISPERIKVCGYPKFVEGRCVKNNNSFRKCMALLARDSFRSSNMCLLDILSHFSDEQEIWIKLHPRCDKAYYEKYASEHNFRMIPTEKTVNECLNQDDFDYAISVNTSAYYEALMRGLPCLRLYDGKFNLMYGYEDAFGNVDEYNEVYNRINNMNTEDYQKNIDNVLEYAIGWGVDNYQDMMNN